jgi:lactoylglutathione lyase
VRDGLDVAPVAGYRRLTIAREGLTAPQEFTDPDGNRVRLVPAGHDGIEQLELELAVRSLAATAAFYKTALELDDLGRVGSGERARQRFRCGASLIALHEDPAATLDPPMRAPGYRYTTFQVFDVVGEHRGILARGGREGSPPVRLGEVAYISFVRDPDGNWIEISQRKSLTGSLDSPSPARYT